MNQAAFAPFLSARLDAVRCALRWVASIMSTSVLSPSRASSMRMRAKTPLRLQRTHLLYSVFGGPYSAGASRHLNPFRLMNIIPLSTRLSSTRGIPCDFGKKGLRRFIWASDSKKDHSYRCSCLETVIQTSIIKSMGPDPNGLSRQNNPTEFFQFQPARIKHLSQVGSIYLSVAAILTKFLVNKIGVEIGR